MIKTIELFPGVTLRCCRDDRFKQGVLSLQFLRPMCREEAALNALLPAVLLRGTKSCPDMRAITLRLEEGLTVLLGDSSALAVQMDALAATLPEVWEDHGEDADGTLDMTSYGDDDDSNDAPIYEAKKK